MEIPQKGPKSLHANPETVPTICQGCAFNDFKSPEDLYRHSVFGYIRLARAITIPNLPILDPGRKAVFEDLLDLKFRIIQDKLLEWLKAQREEIASMSGETLSSGLTILLADVIVAYEREGAQEGIPLEVLEKFRFWHGRRVEALQEEIEMVCASGWIKDPPHRIGFILSVLEMMLRATSLDAEQTLVALNGQLTGKRYKGFILGENMKTLQEAHEQTQSGATDPK